MFTDLLDRLAHQDRQRRQGEAGNDKPGHVGRAGTGHRPGRGGEGGRGGDGQALLLSEGVHGEGHVVDQRRRYSGVAAGCTVSPSVQPWAAWPSGSGKGLQSPLQRFDSARRLPGQRAFPLWRGTAHPAGFPPG